MMTAKQWIVRVAAGAVLFAAGIGAGTWHERSVEAQNRFGQPKTVIHMVVYKFKPFASQDDKDQVLNGIKTLAGQIPGVKNIWLKTGRNQIRDFDGVFADTPRSATFPPTECESCWVGWSAARSAQVSWSSAKASRPAQCTSSTVAGCALIPMTTAFVSLARI